MTKPKFEIHEEDKERLKDLESETIDSCVSFGFDPIIGRGIREAYRVGYERAAHAPKPEVEKLVAVLTNMVAALESSKRSQTNRICAAYDDMKAALAAYDKETQ